MDDRVDPCFQMSVSVIEFEKYQGAGNHFVFVDNREGKYDKILSQNEIVEKICDNNFGVGANGLIEMRRHDSYDFEMGVSYQSWEREPDVWKWQ